MLEYMWINVCYAFRASPSGVSAGADPFPRSSRFRSSHPMDAAEDAIAAARIAAAKDEDYCDSEDEAYLDNEEIAHRQNMVATPRRRRSCFEP